MRVLLVGATGNVGIRLVPALLSHGHTVIAYVRSPPKLVSLLPASIYSQISVIQGSATDSLAIKEAILESACEAVVNAAGVAALAPWSDSDLPQIFQAVVNVLVEAGLQRGKPLRAWFLGGTGALYYPGTQSLVADYFPIFLAHRQNIALLRLLPTNSVDWSLLCPNAMIPESKPSDFTLPTIPINAKLVANAGTPPDWQYAWLGHIPLIGKTLACGLNAPRYKTTLEQNADFIAEDLEVLDSQWSLAAVGIIDRNR